MNSQQPTIKIQIPEPCSQSWDEMTPEAGGRHCISCAKTVVDFTRMTDAQILEMMRKSTGGCGRFRADQVNREPNNPPAGKRFSFAGFYKLAASFLLLFSAGKAAAQEKQVPGQEIVLKDSQTIIKSISGFVTDDTGEPLTGAKIEVTGYDTTFMAGIDGEFRMEIPDSSFQKGNVKISVFFPGYKIEEMILSREDFPLHLEATLVSELPNSTQKGGFRVIISSERKILTEQEIVKMFSDEGDFVMGKMSFPASGNELRSKERELQYKQRENRLDEFLQDYGH